jgi:hypothetical protein
MLTVTPPLALSSDAIWVLITGEGPAVDAARLAHLPGTDKFIALPCAVFDTAGVLPTHPESGDVLTGFRWATVADVTGHAELFGARH